MNRARDPAAGEPGARAPFERLQIVRRIDWRFLLPDPTIGDAVYAGRRDAELIRALRVFGESLVLLDDDAAERAAPWGLAVAVDPTRDELRALAARLRPGAPIYLEQRSGLSPRRRFGSLSLRAADAALVELGFEDVRLHWHFPNASWCEEIVPLADERTVRHALTRRRKTAPARAKAAAARLLLAARVFAAVVPARSITARLRVAGG